MTSDSDFNLEAVCGEVVVRSDGEFSVSRATQTGDVQELVQITATLPELMRRIDAFTSLKRQQVNVYNLQEFCSHSRSEESCARTDAVYIRRGPQPSNITVQKVANSSGPTDPPLPPLEALKHDLDPRSNQWERSSTQVAKGCGVLGLSERLANMEQYTKLYKDSSGPTPRNLVHRVHNLELKLLELESQSHEYAPTHLRGTQA